MAVAQVRWQERALCRGLPPLLFHSDERLVEVAKKVCAACSVREECLAHALAEHEHEGVWGGLTAQERVRLVRRERKHARKQSA